MGLEKVLEEINKKCDEEIAKLEATKDSEIKRIFEITDEKIKKIKETAQKNAQDHIARLEVREISVAELDAKKIIANAVNDVLEKVWHEGIARIQSISTEKNQMFLKKLIEKASVFEDGFIYCNARDAGFVKAHTKYRFGGTIDCIGGIKVENADRTVMLDYTYDSIIQTLKSKISKDLANILFEK